MNGPVVIIHGNPNPRRIGDVPAGNYTEFLDDGTIILHGTARVTKRLWIPANAVSAIGAIAATKTLNGNGYIVYSFADNVDRNVQADIILPDDLDRSADCVLCMGWSSPATSKVAVIDMTYLITAPDDLTDQAGTADTGNLLDSSSTADGLVLSEVVTIAGGTIAADEICLHLQIERDGNNGADTLGDILELHGIALKYVANRLGEDL
jgi:hypothetical protein